MVKTLRFLFLGMFVMLGMNAIAEDIIWQEDWSAVTDFSADPNNFNSNYTFTGMVFNEEDGTVKSGTKFYNDALAGGTAPELLIAKNGGEFRAKVDLNGKTGNMTLSFKTNRKDMTVTVEGATLGEKERTGNTDTYPLMIESAIGEISIIFSMTTSSNGRLDDIKLYQGTGLKPAGLSWGKASATLTIGEEVTLKLSNENNLPVVFSSSNTEVATIDQEGVITLVAAGKTTLTAAFGGNEEYEAQTVSIDVTVKAAGGDDPDPQPTDVITVAKALEIIELLENGKPTSEVYQVKGFVVGTPDFQRKADETLYGNVNFDMADSKGGSTILTVFRAKNFDNQNFTEETINVLKEGDEVVLKGKLQKYVKNDVVTPELTSGYLVSVNGNTGSIHGTEADALQKAGTVYNLAGQRVEKAEKGVFIMNGKKQVVK